MDLPWSINIDDLPVSIRNNILIHVQKIFLGAFNNAWNEYKKSEELKENVSRDETAFKVDWIAVKKSCNKNKIIRKN